MTFEENRYRVLIVLNQAACTIMLHLPSIQEFKCGRADSSAVLSTLYAVAGSWWQHSGCETGHSALLMSIWSAFEPWAIHRSMSAQRGHYGIRASRFNPVGRQVQTNRLHMQIYQIALSNRILSSIGEPHDWFSKALQTR